MGDDSVSGELGVAGVAVNGEGAAVVGVVTAEGGAEIEDEKFAHLGGAFARRAAGGVALVVVAGGRERLAEGVDSGGLQFVKDGEFGDAGGDDLAGASVHGFAGGDSVAEEGEFVRVFAAAEFEESGIDVVERWGGGVAESVDVSGGASGGFDADASGVLGGGVLFDAGGNGLLLILAEGAEPLGLEGDNMAGSVVLRGLIGGNEQALIVREEHGGVVMRPGTVAGEVLHVLGPSEQGEIELLLSEQAAQTGLAVGGMDELHDLRRVCFRNIGFEG